NNIGRVCHLEPMRWKDDWPEIGVDMDMNGIGEPVYVWKKPNVGKNYPITAPQASDEFISTQLGFQWSWNHNPINKAWSLTQKPGFLMLNALTSPSFLKAKNTLTQKVMGQEGKATTLLLANQMKDGQKAGLCLIGKQYNLIGLEKQDGKLSLFVDINGNESKQTFNVSKIYLRVNVTAEEGKNQFYFSTDNKKFYSLGESFPANFGNWKGPKIGLFSYNKKDDEGTALFDWFHYDYDGPKNSAN
ncbi:MAG: beta-xylosidase, partial [Bacteroidales bacterium]|nr:beta-xylosidase [Bacteroidales bacterium]